MKMNSIVQTLMIPQLYCSLLMGGIAGGAIAAEETPTSTLLVLNKGNNSLAIIDPIKNTIVAEVPAGRDPHEVVGSADGKWAFVSNYGVGHTLSVIDLVAQQPMPAVELGALRSPHGLALADGKVYFTAEGSKVIGRYDPPQQQIDWVLGLGQERTHMIVVSKDGKKIFTSNVNSDTISIIEQGAGGFGPGPRGGPGGNGGPGDPWADLMAARVDHHLQADQTGVSPAAGVKAALLPADPAAGEPIGAQSTWPLEPAPKASTSRPMKRKFGRPIPMVGAYPSSMWQRKRWSRPSRPPRDPQTG
jgi:hypothetical protein